MWFPNSPRKVARDLLAFALTLVVLYLAALYMNHLTKLAQQQRVRDEVQQEAAHLTMCRQLATDYATAREDLATCRTRAANDFAACNRSHP